MDKMPLSKEQFERAQEVLSVEDAWRVFFEVQSDEIRQASPSVIEKMREIFYAGAGSMHHMMGTISRMPEPDAEDAFTAVCNELEAYANVLRAQMPQFIQDKIKEWQDGHG